MAKGKKVRITKAMYLNSRPVMYFCRLLGYCPLTVESVNSKIYLKWSPYYAWYSFAFGAFLIIGSYLQDYLNQNAHSETPSSAVSILTATAGYTAWLSAIFCAIYVLPNKFDKFRSYVECINKIDSIIKTTYAPFEKYVSVLMLMVAIVPGIASFSIDFVMLSAYDGGFPRAVALGGVLHIMQAFATTVPFIIHHLVHSLEKRIDRINYLLEMENLKYEKRSKFTLAQTRKTFLISDDVAIASNKVIKLYEKGLYNMNKILSSEDCNIIKLRRTYLKLCDAATLLNEIIGETIMVSIVGVGMQLVHPFYFLIVTIDGSIPFLTQACTTNIVKDIIWEMLIINACYSCQLQINKTEKLVCRLLSWNSDQKFKLKVKTFALCLGLRKIRFTGCYFFTVDRLLLTDMLGTVTNVLMLLLQMQKG